MAVVTMVRPGKGVYLELEDQEFEIDSPILGDVLKRGDALCAHIIPVGYGHWLVGPGWLVWPTRLGARHTVSLEAVSAGSNQTREVLAAENEPSRKETKAPKPP